VERDDDGDERQKAETIAVVEEDGKLANSTGHDVVHPAGDLDARRTRHSNEGTGKSAGKVLA
jgi:hypothetical protein